MKKRLSAILLSVLMSTSVLSSNVSTFASSNGSTTSNTIKSNNEIKVAEGTVSFNIDMTKHEKGKKIRLWVPVASTNEYQKVEDVKIDVKGTEGKLNKDEIGNLMVYIEWGEEVDPKDRIATISFKATRPEVIKPELKEEGQMPTDLDEYLKPSKMIVIDGEVKKLSDEITKNEVTTLGKARAIYDWIIANMNRNNDVIGCGTGEVEKLLSTKEGKCTDINSVFVALCRAQGIPARDIFGIRMNADDITKNQHCWAQFYLPGTGWVFADPADVLKAVLTNKWSKDQKEAKDLQEYFFGNLEEKRVALSVGRDIILNPKQDGEPLNNFEYPYAEIDGKALDYYNTTEFSYTISFKK